MSKIFTEIAKWMTIAWFISVLVGMMGLLSDKGEWQQPLIYIASFIYAVVGLVMIVIAMICGI